MNWKALLKALGVAAVSGAVAATGTALSTEKPPSGVTLGITAGTGALVGVLGYLAKSPLGDKK